jgi:restriction system protein
MPMPTYEQLMLPLLQLSADGAEHSIREAVETLGNHFGLSSEERTELLPSGSQPRFANRVGWARTDLKKAGLLDATRMSHFRITDRGLALLAEKPETLNYKVLRRYPEYVEYLTPRSDKSTTSSLAVQGGTPSLASAIPPLERLADAYSQLRQDAEEQLLAKVKAATPEFFERLVIDLLRGIGYGGSFRDAAQAIGRSGDGGVDGLIKEDVLGLDMIYVQAKRYTVSNVPAGDVRDFVGALVGKKARKGVFFMTSGFSPDAMKYVDTVGGMTVRFVDGRELVSLMIEHGVGISSKETYAIPRIDDDYFEDAGIS